MNVSKNLFKAALAVLLVVSMVVITACGGTQSRLQPKICTYKDMVVGFLQTGSEGGWRAANTASFKETATQLGITLKFYDSQNDLAKQVAGFRQFIQDKEVNVIVLAALETTGWDDVLKEAQAAGKTVVLEDRRIDAADRPVCHLHRLRLCRGRAQVRG